MGVGVATGEEDEAGELAAPGAAGVDDVGVVPAAEQKGRDFGKDGREIKHGFGLLRLDGSGGGFGAADQVHVLLHQGEDFGMEIGGFVEFGAALDDFEGT